MTVNHEGNGEQSSKQQVLLHTKIVLIYGQILHKPYRNLSHLKPHR